eukprot:TRINITY_DN7414_c0_g1_i1.p1 TRINITY_DN7414_c0_g1~~TRINITY_DN7414_c0_g1_i1.p1  ORF type:complete len:731 (-),score=128.79 TRINITY_DN7414_c0_g1_i1:640-2769(-)
MTDPELPTLLQTSLQTAGTTPGGEQSRTSSKQSLAGQPRNPQIESAEAKPKRNTARDFTLSFREAVHKHGWREVLIYDGEQGPELRFTLEELDARSTRLARHIWLKWGVNPGSMVVTVADNRPELVTLYLACIKLGAVFVPLATDIRKDHCHRAVRLYNPALIVCDHHEYAPFFNDDGSEFSTILLPGARSGPNKLTEMELQGDVYKAADSLPDVHATDEPALILSTSGSTGQPKGVVHSRLTLANIADARTTFFGCSSASGIECPWDAGQPGEKRLLWVHMRGAASLFLLSSLLRGEQVIMADVYPNGPGLWAAMLDKHRIDYFLLFGAAMHQLLRELPEHCFDFVKGVAYGGSCVSPSLVQQSMKQFPKAQFTQLYGMTEVFPLSCLRPEDHVRGAGDKHLLSSAGKVVADLFIEDADRPGSGLPPPPEKQGVGQICAHTGFILKEYFNNPEKTRELLPDGKYVRTGDLGWIDENGYLFVVGRVKDIIPTHRGYNVAPRDIEDVMYNHGLIGEAMACGMPHPSGAGEMVTLWVSPKAGSQVSPAELRSYCDSSGLATWQLPEVITVLSEGLPLSGCKPDRKAPHDVEWLQKLLLKRLKEATLAQPPANPCSLKLASEVFDMLAGEKQCMFGLDELRPVFGDVSGDLLRCFFADSSHVAANVSHAEWLALLGRMDLEERRGWLLQTGSLVALRERELICLSSGTSQSA